MSIEKMSYDELSCKFADTTYDKWQSDVYMLKSCPIRYKESDQEEMKLRLDLLKFGLSCAAAKRIKITGSGTLQFPSNLYDNGTGEHFVYIQSTAATVWVINHNMGFNPGVTLVDFNGDVIEGAIQYTIDNSQITITFTTAKNGKAFLS